jgi:Uma2 family endonuclease
MSTITPIQAKPEVMYPEGDGQPMAENTLQFEYIAMLKGGLDAVFRNDPNVFVAGDLFWYPVEGDSEIRTAPDTMVVFGRPKGHRRSYLQWLENGIAPQITFEVLSPSNRGAELIRKFRFYEHYGVEEYYTYDPDFGDLAGWRRVGDKLQEIPSMLGWVSPRLGVRFELERGELKIYGPDGRPFATYLELIEQRERERQERENERQEKEKERERADRLAAQLRRLGVEPEK